MTTDTGPAAAPAAHTGGRTLARNTLWSLIGQATPMLAGAVAIPVLLHALGTEAFGVLTLTWTVIGYFTLLDLGLGRGITRAVAEGLGAGRTGDLAHHVGTGLFMLLGFGVLGAIVSVAATPWVVHRGLNVPEALEPETVTTFYLLAATLPAVLLNAGLSGVLAAYQRFGTLNLIRIPLSILSFAGPMAVLPYSHNLAHVVGSIVVVRYLGVFAYLAIVARLVPGLGTALRWRPQQGLPMLQSGGWIAVINLIMALFASVDRLLVGAWLSVSAVAYYGMPQEMAIKMFSFPGPLAIVLFPAFATSHQSDPARVRTMFLRGQKAVFCVLFPVTFGLVALGGDILRIWLGPAFAEHGSAALQILAVGAFATGLSFIPSTLVQAVGQPRRVALLQLIEIPFYLLILVWGIRSGGIAWAAFAWTLRAVVDYFLVMALAAALLPAGGAVMRGMLLPALGTFAALAAAFAVQPLGLVARVALTVIVVGPFVLWAAGRGLAEERRALMAGLSPRT